MRTKSTFTAPILLLVILTLQTFASRLDYVNAAISSSPYLSWGIVLLIVYALPAAIYMQIRGKALTERMRIRPFRFDHLYLLVLALLALEAGSSALELLSAGLLGNTKIVLYSGSAFAVDGDPAVYRLIVFAVLPAILDEWVFRGILTVEYESVGPLPGALIASLMCASTLLSVGRFVPALCCALVFAAVMFATRSLFASVFLHILHNIVSLILERYLTRAANIESDRRIILMLALLVVAAVSMFAMLAEMQRIYAMYAEEKLESEYEIMTKRGERTKFLHAISTPPFIAYWALLIAFGIWTLCT